MAHLGAIKSKFQSFPFGDICGRVIGKYEQIVMSAVQQDQHIG